MEKPFGIHSRRATVKLIILDRDGVINQDRDDFVKESFTFWFQGTVIDCFRFFDFSIRP